MNLRCSFCQTPFTIGRLETLDALQHLDANNLTHYDAHCPRCRRSTPVLRQKLEMTMPNWRKALKELEKELKANPQQESPLPKPEADSAPEAESKPEHHHHRTRARPRPGAPRRRGSSRRSGRGSCRAASGRRHRPSPRRGSDASCPPPTPDRSRAGAWRRAAIWRRPRRPTPRRTRCTAS